ncbi:hypothetical protein TCE0_013f01138 [Talaromyces pinophilus]|uniref:Uncharacterized protein n=1 Tax=Talaromyces pinophilus TaxID=128442 RepID=A0A698XPW0_TALPI|nr:hypothetical protein TCE0_013f01138 [Talaromyces pinophilus]
MPADYSAAPSEIVFPLTASSSTQEPCVFRYDNGPVKVKVPRRRGRPVGSKKIFPSKDHHLETKNEFHFVHMAGDNASSISDETRITIRKRVMANYMHLWKSFYTIESLTSLNPMTDYWIPLAFYDDAFLHLLIGCADSHNTRCMHFEERPIALRHMQKALSIIKTRIATMRAVADETIAVIATLAFVEKTRGSFDNWRIHMNGLKRLVDMRGGLVSLETKPMVMTKVFRADLCGSIDTVGVPFFSRHYLPSPAQATIDSKQTTTGFDALDAMLNLDDGIKQHITALEEATRLTSSLMMNKNNNQADAARIRFLVTRTQYTLLSTPKYPNTVLELSRLVLILYSENMVNESPPRLPICDVLIARFRDIWLTAGNIGISVPLQFKLWSLFVAASVISVVAEPLMDWYLAYIDETASQMRISEWSHLVDVFDMFLWDEKIHGRRYREIWDDAKRADPHEVLC